MRTIEVPFDGDQQFDMLSMLNDLLTDREMEVIKLRLNGMSNQKIAELLSITKGTVKNHVVHVCDKLKVALQGEDYHEPQTRRARLLELINNYYLEKSAEKRSASEQFSINPADSGLLTERQLEILNLVAQGYSNEQIAQHLFLSIGTVKNHLHQARIRLSLVGAPLIFTPEWQSAINGRE